jgi:hypothetical protein
MSLSLPAALLPGVQRNLAPLLDALPPEAISKEFPFSSMDQQISQEHVDAYNGLALEIARQLTQDDEHVTATLACKREQGPQPCIDGFVRRFGRHAFRHALSDEEFRFLRRSYQAPGISSTDLRGLIALMLSSPQFLYQVERLREPVRAHAPAAALDGYSLASRLAYHYWQTMPDEELLRAAERGELDEEAGLVRALDRMLADPRTERSLRTFVFEWLDLQSLRQLDALVGDPVFDSFAGEDLPSPDLREAMISDVLESFLFHTTRGDRYADWLGSPFSFARSAELAALYGVRTWSGNGEPPRFAGGTRAGLLTRGALLASGSPNTRPIMKGVFIRRRLLCDELPPPPANANNVVPALSAELTTRQVVEQLTEIPGTACASCHTYQINPLGFATENYDGLGRLRSEQRLFSSGGAEVGRRAVDTHVVPRIALYDEAPVDGPLELLQRILESGKGEACFARQYVRFSLGRQEDPKQDGCLLEQIRRSLHGPKGLREALRAPALTPAFRQSPLARSRRKLAGP